jgi:hypothetical protein
MLSRLAIRRRPSATDRVRKRSRRLVDQFLQTCVAALAQPLKHGRYIIKRQKSCFSGEESSRSTLSSRNGVL